MANPVRLSELAVGTPGKIRDYQPTPDSLNMITRLIDLGFVPGETVVVHQGIQLTTGALTATVQQTSFGLGWREASLVWVDILDAHR